MDQHIRWLRPREYLQQMHMINEAKRQQEVKKAIFRPRRSSTRVIGALIGLGEEAKDSVLKEQSQLSGTEAKSIKSILKQKIVTPQSDTKAPPIKIVVVNTIERDETPEEKQKRLAQAEEEKRNQVKNLQEVSLTF